jgi:fused signal recognition particle receptor
MGWLDRLKQGLKKTHDRLVGQIASVVAGHKRLDDVLLEKLEEILIGADLGVNASLQILDELKERARRERLDGTESERILDWLREILIEILKPAEGALQLRTDGQPTVILVLGVNGSGKTTSIAKLAQRLKEQGLQHITIAAADTFRAAAIEQLEIWAERVGAKLIRHQPGADPGAVSYDAVEYALNHQQDVVLIDTAGRLHTKHNLMEELKKIKRVVEKRLGREIDERLLVLDATIGQNALAQAKMFHEAVPLTGLVVTKLDGTAKGGIVVPIARELQIPVKFIGVGESAEDLREFKAREFVEALLA